jgi:hypothetical protein
MKEWNTFKERNPSARLVAIDIQPYETTQAQELAGKSCPTVWAGCRRNIELE